MSARQRGREKTDGMDLQITVRTENNVSIITVQGEIDLYSSPSLRDSLIKAVKHARPKMVIGDLSGVTYTDSSGIATLVEGLQFANAVQAAFKLVGLSPAVSEVFQLVRLERVFRLYATVEEALRDG